MKLKFGVSGSSGFLGKSLVHYLEQQQYEVVKIGRNGFLVEPVDYVIDLGAYGNLYEQTDIYETYKANLMKTINLLSNKYRGIVYVSTSSVSLPKQTFYSQSKKACEDLIKLHVAKFGTPCVIARPYTVIGVGEHSCHLIPTLIKNIYYSGKMQFVPEPVHDYIDVSDVVSALVLLAQNAEKHKGEIFEIGSGVQYTNQEVKEIVEKNMALVCKSKAKIEIVESLREYDTDKWIADNQPLLKLGWKPKKSLEDSIKEMISDYLPGV